MYHCMLYSVLYAAHRFMGHLSGKSYLKLLLSLIHNIIVKTIHHYSNYLHTIYTLQYLHYIYSKHIIIYCYNINKESAIATIC